MKYCPKCGSQLIRVSKFCPECGYDLVKLEVEAAPDVPAEDQIRKNIEKIEAQISKLELAKKEEEARVAQEKRIAEENERRLAEQKALEEARLAEEKRIAEENERRLAQQKALEETKRRLAEEERLRAEAKKAEQERLKIEKAEAKRKKTEEKLAKKLSKTASILRIVAIALCVVAVGLGVMAILFATVLRVDYYGEKDANRVVWVLFVSISILLGIAAAIIAGVLFAKYARKIMFIPIAVGVVGLALGATSIPVLNRAVSREEMARVWFYANTPASKCPFILVEDSDEYIINIQAYVRNWDITQGRNYEKGYWLPVNLGMADFDSHGIFYYLSFSPYFDLGNVQIYLVDLDYEIPNHGQTINWNKVRYYSDPFRYDQYAYDVYYYHDGWHVDATLTGLAWHTN